jgi:putative transcriptional regulator
MKSYSLSNQFLIAMPRLADMNFHHTVSYICEHNEHGAIGIIINRPLDITLGEILSQMKIQPSDTAVNDLAVHYGGPVRQQHGFVIHTKTSRQWRSSIGTSSHLNITTSQDILEAIAENQGPDEFFIALGYAGWEADQLEHELLENTWLNCDADPDILFKLPYAQRWEAAAKQLGIDINTLSGDAGHA